MAGFRFRKSFKIAPGLKLNLNKKSVGVSIGGKYLRRTYNTSGRRTTTVGTPISGLYYTESKNMSHSKQTTQTPKKVVKAKVSNSTTPKAFEPIEKKEYIGFAAIAALLLLIGITLGMIILLEGTDDVSDALVESTTTVTSLSNDAVQKDDGLWIVANGITSASHNGVMISDAGNWYYVKNGIIQSDYTGLQPNNFGNWYIENGSVDFAKNDVVAYAGSQYFVKDGKVDTSVNGILNTSAGWLYFANGKVDTGFSGVRQNEFGSWYVRGGKVQFDYNGTVASEGRTYSVENGKAYLTRSIVATTQTAATEAATIPQSTTAYYEAEDYDGPMDVPGDYVGNFNTRVFHKATCRFVSEIQEKETGQPRDWYISNGYRPCEVCHP